MDQIRQHRSLIAWALYACVLFSAFTCAISHGQMSGLQLSGLEALYCSANGNTSASLDEAPVELPSGNQLPMLDCPLCSGAVVAISALLLLSWLVRLLGRPPRPLEPHHDTSPRCTWPPANPRAP